MRYGKKIGQLVIAAGLACGGAATLSAADWNVHQDIRHDQTKVNALRGDIARDQARLNEDLHFRRMAAVAHDRNDLARDQRALKALQRDMRHDVRNSWR